MKPTPFILVAWLAPACGTPPAPAAPTPSPSSSQLAQETPQPAPSPAGSAEEGARRFFEAMVASDVDGMKRLTLSHAELASLSRKAPPADEYAREVDEFLGQLAREMKEAKQKPRVESVEVENSETLRANDNQNVVHDLRVANVRPILSVAGERRSGPPFLFVETAAGFKLSIKN